MLLSPVYIKKLDNIIDFRQFYHLPYSKYLYKYLLFFWHILSLNKLLNMIYTLPYLYFLIKRTAKHYFSKPTLSSTIKIINTELV